MKSNPNAEQESMGREMLKLEGSVLRDGKDEVLSTTILLTKLFLMMLLLMQWCSSNTYGKKKKMTKILLYFLAYNQIFKVIYMHQFI